MKNAQSVLAQEFKRLLFSRPAVDDGLELLVDVHRVLTNIALSHQHRCHAVEMRREYHRFELILKALALALLRLEETGQRTAVEEILSEIDHV